ncbi:hypothetical protein Tco_1210787 [Tanacetum coccineum]
MGIQMKDICLNTLSSNKAFRCKQNKRTKRVEESLHINFLEDQPNVAGSGPDWMFDLDFLTNIMNYIPVSVENHVVVDAGTQESYVASLSGNNEETPQEYILFPLHPHGPRILVEYVDSEDVADKEEQHNLTEAEQALKDDLEKLVTQEMVAKSLDDVLETRKVSVTSKLNGSDALTEVLNPDNLNYDLFNQSEQIMTSSEQSNDRLRSLALDALDPSHSSTTITVEVPKELPTVSMVYTSLKELKRYLTGFDLVVKERTTATAITEGTQRLVFEMKSFRL